MRHFTVSFLHCLFSDTQKTSEGLQLSSPCIHLRFNSRNSRASLRQHPGEWEVSCWAPPCLLKQVSLLQSSVCYLSVLDTEVCFMDAKKMMDPVFSQFSCFCFSSFSSLSFFYCFFFPLRWRYCMCVHELLFNLFCLFLDNLFPWWFFRFEFSF